MMSELIQIPVSIETAKEAPFNFYDKGSGSACSGFAYAVRGYAANLLFFVQNPSAYGISQAQNQYRVHLMLSICRLHFLIIFREVGKDMEPAQKKHKQLTVVKDSDRAQPADGASTAGTDHEDSSSLLALGRETNTLVVRAEALTQAAGDYERALDALEAEDAKIKRGGSPELHDLDYLTKLLHLQQASRRFREDNILAFERSRFRVENLAISVP